MQETGIFDLLLRAGELLERDATRSLDPIGLSTARMHVLWVIHRSGPCSQQRIAEELRVTPRNVTGLVDALVDKGYVTRERDPGDRRAVLVTPTPSAISLLEQSVAGYHEVTAALIEVVPAADRDPFLRSLSAVVAKLEQLVESEQRR